MAERIPDPLPMDADYEQVVRWMQDVAPLLAWMGARPPAPPAVEVNPATRRRDWLLWWEPETPLRSAQSWADYAERLRWWAIFLSRRIYEEFGQPKEPPEPKEHKHDRGKPLR